MAAFVVTSRHRREHVVEWRGFFSTHINLFRMPEDHIIRIKINHIMYPPIVSRFG